MLNSHTRNQSSKCRDSVSRVKNANKLQITNTESSSSVPRDQHGILMKPTATLVFWPQVKTLNGGSVGPIKSFTN